MSKNSLYSYPHGIVIRKSLLLLFPFFITVQSFSILPFVPQRLSCTITPPQVVSKTCPTFDPTLTQSTCQIPSVSLLYGKRRPFGFDADELESSSSSTQPQKDIMDVYDDDDDIVVDHDDDDDAEDHDDDDDDDDDDDNNGTDTIFLFGGDDDNDDNVDSTENGYYVYRFKDEVDGDEGIYDTSIESTDDGDDEEDEYDDDYDTSSESEYDDDDDSDDDDAYDDSNDDDAYDDDAYDDSDDDNAYDDSDEDDYDSDDDDFEIEDGEEYHDDNEFEDEGDYTSDDYDDDNVIDVGSWEVENDNNEGSDVDDQDEKYNEDLVEDGLFPTSIPPSLSLSGDEKAWRYAGKPLLRIGAKGIAPSHGNSLKELLEAHTVVRVKVGFPSRYFQHQQQQQQKQQQQHNPNKKTLQIRVSVDKDRDSDKDRDMDDTPPNKESPLSTILGIVDQLLKIAKKKGAPDNIEVIQVRVGVREVLLGLPGTTERIKQGKFPPPPPAQRDDNPLSGRNPSPRRRFKSKST